MSLVFLALPCLAWCACVDLLCQLSMPCHALLCLALVGLRVPECLVDLSLPSIQLLLLLCCCSCYSSYCFCQCHYRYMRVALLLMVVGQRCIMVSNWKFIRVCVCANLCGDCVRAYVRECLYREHFMARKNCLEKHMDINKTHTRQARGCASSAVTHAAGGRPGVGLVGG